MVILIRGMKKPFLKTFKGEVYVSHLGQGQCPEAGSLTSSISVPTVLRFHGNLAGGSHNVQDSI